MKFRTLIFIVFSAFSIKGYSQPDQSVNSKISEVTVFLSRAQVTREAKARLEAGKSTIVITGLASGLDPESIQVAGKGNFTILGTSHRQNFLTELNVPKSLKILKDSLELYRKWMTTEQNQKEILNKEEQLLILNQKIGGSNQNVTVVELKAMSDFYRSRMTEIYTLRMRQDDKVNMLANKINRVQQQVNSQNELFSRNTSEIVINLSTDAPTQGEFTVTYVVSNAGWYPVYDVRATNIKSPLQLSYKANVFQGTGEEWKNVHLKLSTSNPNLGGVKPELSAWYLDFYVPISLEMKRYKAAGAAMRSAVSKEDEISADDKEMAAPAATAADYVQAVQTTLNTEFNISIPYTVASSNQPTLVDIQNYQLTAGIEYSVVPKLDPDAFLIAKAVGWEEYNLLPGEANIFFEGTFVGKTFIDPNSIKDTLSVSLGREKRIVVKREKIKDFTARKTIGTNIRESRAYEISIRNTKLEAIKIVVEDQVPVAQNNQIEVTMLDAGGASYNKETGKLTWTWIIQPNETKKSTFKFEVKYPKDRTVGGL